MSRKRKSPCILSVLISRTLRHVISFDPFRKHGLCDLVNNIPNFPSEPKKVVMTSNPCQNVLTHDAGLPEQWPTYEGVGLVLCSLSPWVLVQSENAVLLPTKSRMINQRIGMCPQYLKDKAVPFSSGFSPPLRSFLRTLVLRNHIRLTPRAAGSSEFRFPSLFSSPVCLSDTRSCAISCQTL